MSEMYPDQRDEIEETQRQLDAIRVVLADPRMWWAVKRRYLARYDAVTALAGDQDRPQEQEPGLLPWERLTPDLVAAAEATRSDEQWLAFAEEWFPGMLVMGSESEPQPVDPQVARPQIERAVRMGSFAVLDFSSRAGEALAAIAPADTVRLILHVALAHLVGNSLVTVADPGAFERFISSEVPEPFWQDVREELDAATLRRRQAAATLRGAS